LALSDAEIREVLAAGGLRVTDIRVAVYRALEAAGAPVSHRDAVEALPGLDRVSVFRNLVTLAEAGLVRRMELGDHTWRFELARQVEADHHHAHFTCVACGEVTCLDDVEIAIKPGANSAHATLLSEAEVQLRGVCVECR